MHEFATQWTMLLLAMSTWLGSLLLAKAARRPIKPKLLDDCAVARLLANRW